MSTNLAAPASAQLVRHYRDFLTPALHARFVDAATILLALCYAEAVWLGEWDCKSSRPNRKCCANTILSQRALAMVSTRPSWRTDAITIHFMSSYFSAQGCSDSWYLGSSISSYLMIVGS